MAESPTHIYMVAIVTDDWFLPCGWDPDCRGALQVDETDPVAFTSRDDARKAIRVSKAKCKLDIAREEVCNEDWASWNSSRIKIVKVKVHHDTHE